MCGGTLRGGTLRGGALCNGTLLGGPFCAVAHCALHSVRWHVVRRPFVRGDRLVVCASPLCRGPWDLRVHFLIWEIRVLDFRRNRLPGYRIDRRPGRSAWKWRWEWLCLSTHGRDRGTLCSGPFCAVALYAAGRGCLSASRPCALVWPARPYAGDIVLH